MADDLEAFLRRAAQRRAQRRNAPPPAAPAQPPRTPPASPQQQRQQSSPPEEILEAVIVPESPSRFASHVDTTAFAHRAAHLGEDIAMADEHLEAHMHQAFDHPLHGQKRKGELGSLSSLDAYSHEADASESLASEIIALLQDPVSLRNAIILAEVFAPPHQRWD